MSEQPTGEQVVIQDLVNQLADKDRSIVNYRVTITQLRGQVAALLPAEEAIETVEDKKKKDSKS